MLFSNKSNSRIAFGTFDYFGLFIPSSLVDIEAAQMFP